MAKQKRKDPLVWGVILILIGLIFLLKIDVWYVIAHLWPVVLIVWGAWKLYFGIKESKEKSESKQD